MSNLPSSDPGPASERANPLTPFGRYVPFLEHLAIRPVACENGSATFEMTVDEPHLRTRGILHGGVFAALLDTAMGMAAGTTAPAGHFVVTAQLNVNMIRPAWQGETLRATGEVRHSGKLTAVAYGEIRTEQSVLVATGTATFLFLPSPEPEHAAFERRPDE
jgi:uncharacterized protein (TIGR00369 family)